LKIIGIIPARYGSTRFPGKPLVKIHGKTMIQRVAEQAAKSEALEHILVATDDERIFTHVESLGIKVVMTSQEHASGTDRCLEALEISGLDADAIINIQGDEPFVHPSLIDLLAECICRPEVEIATLVKRIHDTDILLDPNKVKCVFAPSGKALYFSRSAIPHIKGFEPEEWIHHHHFYKHIGLYGYKTQVLREICQIRPSLLELAESLEQLRWLEVGKAIYVAETEIETPAIDTPDDLDRIVRGAL
jgi:3-deoxy-manno-octulosonate cytidylyltransferase (CMP-KDO synthetase)